MHGPTAETPTEEAIINKEDTHGQTTEAYTEKANIVKVGTRSQYTKRRRTPNHDITSNTINKEQEGTATAHTGIHKGPQTDSSHKSEERERRKKKSLHGRSTKEQCAHHKDPRRSPSKKKQEATPKNRQKIITYI